MNNFEEDDYLEGYSYVRHFELGEDEDMER
jgi:hypothetical protein